MAEELKKILAFLFKREGEEMEEEDFIYIQSVDLDWYSSDDAKQVLNMALKSDLVEKKGVLIRAKFDFENVKVPIDFEPTKELFEEEDEKDIFSELLEQISSNSELSNQEIMSQVNEKQDRMNIEVKTALLLVAQERDVILEDRDEYIEEISKEIRGKD